MTLPLHLLPASLLTSFLLFVTVMTGTPATGVRCLGDHVAVDRHQGNFQLFFLRLGHDKTFAFLPSLYRYYTRFAANVSLVPNSETIKELVDQVGF